MRFADSTDRCSADYVRFGVGFVTFMFAVGGIVFGAVWAAVLGFFTFLATLVSFFTPNRRCEY